MSRKAANSCTTAPRIGFCGSNAVRAFAFDVGANGGYLTLAQGYQKTSSRNRWRGLDP